MDQSFPVIGDAFIMSLFHLLSREDRLRPEKFMIGQETCGTIGVRKFDIGGPQPVGGHVNLELLPHFPFGFGSSIVADLFAETADRQFLSHASYSRLSHAVHKHGWRRDHRRLSSLLPLTWSASQLNNLPCCFHIKDDGFIRSSGKYAYP